MFKKILMWLIILFLGGALLSAILGDNSTSNKKREERVSRSSEHHRDKSDAGKKVVNDTSDDMEKNYMHRFKRRAAYYVRNSVKMTTYEKQKYLLSLEEDLVTSNTNGNRKAVNSKEVAKEWYNAGLPLASLKYVSQDIKDEVVKEDMN